MSTDTGPLPATVAIDPPAGWERLGGLLRRQAAGAGSEVVGDPAIVWDPDLPGWRMFLFFAPPGHGQSVAPCARPAAPPTRWSAPEPLVFANPERLLGGMIHKPVVVVDATHPNRAACIGGRYCLLGIAMLGRHKVVQRAWAGRLAGPWELEAEALIPHGEADAFDGKHADAVNGLWFAERGEILYTYMGYPDRPQPRAGSPWGNAQGMAVSRGAGPARKLGEVLPPHPAPGHWAAGWVGGMQIMPGRSHRWTALLNASPTPPRPDDGSVAREEPPPSLGGFAVCDQAWPVSGWRWCDRPIVAIGAIGPAAAADGEGVNFWRHHLLVAPGGTAVYYNSGSYGQEQLYGRVAAP